MVVGLPGYIYIYIVNGSTKLQETKRSGPRSAVSCFHPTARTVKSAVASPNATKGKHSWMAPGQVISPMASRQQTLHSFLPRAPWAGMSEETWEHENLDACEHWWINHTPKTSKFSKILEEACILTPFVSKPFQTIARIGSSLQHFQLVM